MVPCDVPKNCPSKVFHWNKLKDPVPSHLSNELTIMDLYYKLRLWLEAVNQELIVNTE